MANPHHLQRLTNQRVSGKGKAGVPAQSLCAVQVFRAAWQSIKNVAIMQQLPKHAIPIFFFFFLAQ